MCECSRCEGSGLVEADQWPCPECRGKGYVEIPPAFCMATDEEDDPCDYPNCYCA